MGVSDHRIVKRFIVELTYTDNTTSTGALTSMIHSAVLARFAYDDDIAVTKVGLMNNVLGIEAAKARKGWL